MDSDGNETEADSIERAVQLLDNLLYIADGGRSMAVGEYEATTILALLMNKSYRVKVTSRLDDFDEVGTGD
jgi:hypothetical protein